LTVPTAEKPTDLNPLSSSIQVSGLSSNSVKAEPNFWEIYPFWSLPHSAHETHLYPYRRHLE